MNSFTFKCQTYLFSFCMVFPFFVSGQFNTNGDAINLGQECYQLTRESDWESGTILSQSPINLDESFFLSGTYNFGDNDLWGADGIVFMFAKENDVVGDNGGYIGFQGISPSFGWEVDDFLNPSFGDPSEDHMSIMKNGSIYHNSLNNLAGPLTLGNIEDGEDHVFCIIWNAETHTFFASLDEKEIMYTGDIVNDIFNGNPMVYYGFGSATGTKTNEHRVCIKVIENEIDMMEDIMICKGESVILDPDPNALNYTWDFDVSLDNINIENPVASPLETTTYFVTMHFACSSMTDEITVFVQPAPEVEFNTFPSCIDIDFGSVDIITSMSGLTYSIDNSQVFSTDTHFDNLSVGQHSIQIIDNNGCMYEEIFEIETIPSPQLNLLVNPACASQANGALTIQVLAGDNLTYSIDGWFSSSTQLIFSDLLSGDYILDYQDENGCNFQSAFSIPEFDEIEIELETTPSCKDMENGSLDIYSDNLDLEYSIDNQSNWTNGLYYEDLTVGFHTLYVRSDDGCLDSLIFEIQESQIPDVFINVYETACEGLQGGSVNVQIDDQYLVGLDYGPLTNIKNYENLSAGLHVINIQIDDNCVLDFPFDIVEILKPDMSFDIKPSCFGESNGSVEISHDGTQFEMFVISEDGQLMNDLTQLSSGDYLVKAVHIFNCEFLYSFSIPELDAPFVDFETAETCSNSEDGSINIDVAEYTLISFNGSEFSENTSFNNLGAGIYSIEVIDQNSCNSKIEVEITSFDELLVALPIQSGSCIESSALIVPEVISSHGNVSYLWSDGTTDSAKRVDKSEVLSLTVSDLCNSEDFELEINVIEEFTEDNIYIPNIFSPNEDSVNDCFQLRIDPAFEMSTYSLVVFDRWGNKVYESENDADCWDGVFNGRNLELGVYVYVLEVASLQCETEKVIRKVGDITIIK